MSTVETPTETSEPGETEPLPEPIKLRWDGDARDKFRARLEALDTDRSEQALATLDRLKTRVVCETVAEAEAFTEEVRHFREGLKAGVYDWINRGHVSAVERVATTVDGALARHYERHPPEAEGSDLADEREATETETAWRARCPDCGWSRTYTHRVEATVRQYRTGCENCDRGVGVAPVEVATDGGEQLDELIAKRYEAEKFWQQYDIPFAFDTCIKVRRSGLLRGSSGTGHASDTVVHLHVKDEFSDGRLEREADAYLCEKGSMVDFQGREERHRDGDGGTYRPKVTCETCLDRMARWKVEEREAVTDGGAVTDAADDLPDTCPECGSFWSEPDHSGARRCKSCGYVPEDQRTTVYRAECDTCDWVDHSAFLNRATPSLAARVHNEPSGRHGEGHGCGDAEIVEHEGYRKPARGAAILGGEDGE